MAFTQEYLNSPLRQEGALEVIMYVPDVKVHINSVSSDDVLEYANIDDITDIKKYSSTTIATLEKNLWLLNGRFPNIPDGTKTSGYISNTMSDDNGDFETNPIIKVEINPNSKIEYFSVMLNPAVPSAYPKQMSVHVYNGDELLQTFSKNIAEIDTLPSVIFEMNIEHVSRLEIEFIGTSYQHRRIRVSTIMFGKIIYLDNDQIVSSDFMDRTSYSSDTLPTRTFSFNVNNYEHIYDVDNPENGYVALDNQTIVQFRVGYNTFGYELDDNGELVRDIRGYPIIDNPGRLAFFEWDDWKELRLVDVYANSDETATFECGSMLDIMEEIYTEEYYNGYVRSVGEIVDSILAFQGYDLNTVEWSSDGIKKPTYNGSTLLPYDQWEDTSYRDYKINTVLPDVSCREIIQLLAFSIGATILIKDNGRIKFANLDITKPESFTNHFRWTYEDFEAIPAAEKLDSVSTLQDISMPKYQSYIDNSGGNKEVATVEASAINSEITYSDCAPTGIRIAADDTSGASVQYSQLFARRGIVRLGGLVPGKPAKLVIYGYPIVTNTVQERNVAKDTLILETKLMYEDVNKYNNDGSILETEQIKRKYLEWYKKKFKYTLVTRGEPLVDAGDYGIIQTQFTEEMPVYILQNHWTFDGTFAGDMEVIALG